MKRSKTIAIFSALAVFVLALLALSSYFIVRAGYPRKCRQTVELYCGAAEPSLIYSVMKAESGFDEEAVSRAGAVGLMQLLPSTAQFLCEKNGIAFEAERLKEADYNVMLGCMYLNYLLEKFPVAETALAAYNAGEGVVLSWLSDESISVDGATLGRIPYPETREYVKKVMKFRKFYEFFY